MPHLPRPFVLNRRQQEQAQERNRLDKIVENSSEKNRNFFIAYLTLLIYVQAIVFSTTDLQLLVDVDGLNMPLIDLKVPLVGFYVVIPIFVIALHFNFLQNLESHHFKLMAWRQTHQNRQVPRSRIFPFLFDYAILERGSQFHGLVQMTNSILSYYLAPITLGLLLIRFSDRQDFTVTLWHFLCFVVDNYLVWQFRQALQCNEKLINKQPTATATDFWSLKAWKFLLRGLRYAAYVIFGLLILFETVSTGFIGATESEFFVKYVLPQVQAVMTGGALSSVKPKILDYEVPLDKWLNRPREWLLPRINVDPAENVWKPEITILETEAKLANEESWGSYLKKQHKGLNLNNRILRLSDLSQQNLIGSQLRFAQLQGANLSRIHLENADLTGSELQIVNLKLAQLQYAKLDNAQLQIANLYMAQLQEASLVLTQLQGANLNNAQLQGADLQQAHLEGASVSDANLEGAFLLGAKLRCTVLDYSQLQGANLIAAGLQGASLNATDLTGAFLDETNFKGTKLTPKKTFRVLIYKTTLKPSEFSDGSVSIITKHFGKIEGYIQAFDPSYPTIRYETFIVDAKERKEFNECSTKAESSEKIDFTQLPFRHTPSEIGGVAVQKICEYGYYSFPEKYQNDKLSSVKAFRRAYTDRFKPYLQIPKPPQTVLTDIDYNLCTLPECADIRDQIEGLVCSAVLKKQQDKKTRQ